MRSKPEQPFLPLWEPGRRTALVAAFHGDDRRLHRRWRVTETLEDGTVKVGEVEMIYPPPEPWEVRRRRRFAAPARRDVEIRVTKEGFTRRGTYREYRDGRREPTRWLDWEPVSGGGP